MKKTCKIAVFFLALGILLERILNSKALQGLNKRMERISLNSALVERWFTLRDKGISLADYIRSQSCESVAIYGLADFGNHVYEELVGTDIKLIGVDRADIYNNFKMPIRKPEDDMSDIDMIIVTPYLQYEDICKTLRKHYTGRIISLEALITECEKYLY